MICLVLFYYVVQTSYFSGYGISTFSYHAYSSYLEEDIQWKHLCCMRELRVRGIFKPLLEVHVASTPRSDGQSSFCTCYLMHGQETSTAV